MFCMNCGNHVPDDSAVCPYCRTPLARPVDAAPTGARKALPIVALCCGVAGVVTGGGAYLRFGLQIVYHFQNSTASGSPLLQVLTCLLGLAALVCGIIGLIRSIRTGGKKYVTGIVLSAVGIYLAINALSYLLMSALMSSMSGLFDQYWEFFSEL